MVWRPRVTVHDDLSRIHQETRRTAVARGLGMSSITKGEGSLDLTTSDGGTKVAVFGDQADGRFGISAMHRGKLSFIPDIFVAVEDRVTATETKSEQQDTRLDGHDNDVSRIDQKNTAQDGRLDGHDGTISSHGTRIGAVEAKNSSQDTAIAGKASSESVTAVDDRVTRVQEALNLRVTTEVTKRQDADSALSSRVSTAQDSADSAYALAGDANDSASAARSRADSAYSRAGTGISDAASAQSRADAAYALADGRVTQGQFDSLVAGVNNAQSKADANAVKIGQIESWLTENLGYPMPMN